MDAGTDTTLTVASVAAFLGELALLAVLAVAGARIGAGPTSVLLGITFPAVLVVLWGRWLAPRSSRRLGHPQRLAAQVGLVLAAAVLLAVSGPVWWAVVFAVVVAGVFVVAETEAAHRAGGSG